MISPTIGHSLKKATALLQTASDTPALDAEILLAHVLQVSRSVLFAFPERELTLDEWHAFDEMITARAAKMPVAYIIGHKEFFSLDLQVTRDTLIPRPETELLVTLVLDQMDDAPKKVADCGTGSGAIAIALAHARGNWEIHATDCSPKALEVARQNARRHAVQNIIFHEGDWLSALPKGEIFDVIVSNPPYIAENDPFLQAGGLDYEPTIALFSAENGFRDLRQIITDAKNHLKSGGLLRVEHGMMQAAVVRSIFAKMGYSDIQTWQDLSGLDRVTGGRS